ncbi:chemotaxis protein CheW [Vibrio sp. JC009]|uniref:chemotaxis protein CheW n=1 Tax=Vibrio sp. JC009 TaxID=2912314 RepID=UPI0023B04A5E|nr:chemotaxis protein CheW [Vibrio sp. JC009]WED21041.1 chemotaxis protein CheW [Vibrio sp. JC009]
MDKKDHVLSGEEALDEYFTALLDEELLEEELLDAAFAAKSEPEVTPQPEPVVVSESDVVVPNGSDLVAEKVASEVVSAPTLEPKPEAKAKPDYHSHYTELEYNEFEAPEFEAPALEDVQKLLDKLESLDHAAEPEIVTIIEQNTQELLKSEPAVEEIQEWDIAETQQVEIAEPVVADVQETDVDLEVEAEAELETQTGGFDTEDWTSRERSEDFQVLYFDVNGVTFAVPLDELGGIHRKGDMSHLIGRPDWYLGLQTSKEDQFDVVDTAKWVMADRLRDDSYKDAYQYVVMLGRSAWGLASTELKGTEILNSEKVRWREKAAKRPWLAGMVKEKMCALIHVEALINMLDAGLDVKSLDS